MRRFAFALLIVALAGCASPSAAPAPAPKLVAIGDSLTTAANLDASSFGDNAHHSWSTGDESGDGVLSQLERLQQQDPNWKGENLARSGARMNDFAAQAQDAVAARATYVTVLLGGNDACGRGGMTSVETFRAQFRLGAEVLKTGLSNATVYVVSIPDINAVYDALHNDSGVRARWAQLRACPALLGANQTDAQRAAFRERVNEYNAVLAQESATAGFATDDGAVHNATLELATVSDLDFFHPSLAGQARLAEIAWQASPIAHR